jgi:hypothetical protein
MTEVVVQVEVDLVLWFVGGANATSDNASLREATAIARFLDDSIWPHTVSCNVNQGGAL